MPLAGKPSRPETWGTLVPRDLSERRLKKLLALSKRVEIFKSLTSGCNKGRDAAMVAILVEIMPQYKLSVMVTFKHRTGQSMLLT